MVIGVKNLKKKYKNIQAVDSISFEVNRGEIFGFLGPNGAGKSTTIKILTAQIKPDEGEVFVLGENIQKNPNAIREKIGVVFEEQNIYHRLTVYQNLIFAARLFGKGKNKVKEVLDFVKLSHREKDESGKLSRGLKQRILIARALINDPELIFMDEPTSGLDPHIARSIREIIKDLSSKGKTIFLTTHYMEEADELCCRIAIINKGRIAKMDTPEKLKESIGGSFLRIKKEGENTFTEYPSNSKEAAEEIVRLIKEDIPYKIETRRVSLEDVFIQLTGDHLEQWQLKWNA